MADHDAVCALSGLLIGYVPIRVLLLVEQDHKDDSGLEGAYYPLCPAFKARWNRDGNEPYEWDEGAAYRLAHEAFKEALATGRNRPMRDLLGSMPDGLSVRRVNHHDREHPDSYKTRLGKCRAPDWVPTPKRIKDALRQKGLVGYPHKVAYGFVKVYAPRPNFAPAPEEWYVNATASLRALGYSVDRVSDPIRNDTLVVSAGTHELTRDDVRQCLLSGGWPEQAVNEVAERPPTFTDIAYELPGPDGETVRIPVPVAEQEENWAQYDATTHGFKVEAATDGWDVFHAVNGEHRPDARSLERYRARLRNQGVACHPASTDDYGNARGHVHVPAQTISFASLVAQRRMWRYENAFSQRSHLLPARNRRVTWALIREDVWRKALFTSLPKNWLDKRDDGSFNTKLANLRSAFELLVVRAGDKIKEHATLREADPSYPWTCPEDELDHTLDHTGLLRLVPKDPPSRYGLRRSFLHLAVMRARDEVDDVFCDEAVRAFAETSHVANVTAHLARQWGPSHIGYQDSYYGVTAKVYEDWHDLAAQDVAAEKLRRKKQG